MRLDRFFEARYPGLSFSHIQRIIRKGEVRVNGKRAQPKDRLQKGQAIRIPPLKIEPPKPRDDASRATRRTAPSSSRSRSTKTTTCWCSTSRWGSRCRAAPAPTGISTACSARMTGKDGQRPRLVHRLDKDTSGCLLVAKTRFAATALAKTFRTRSARKIYWALVAGVPRPKQGRVSTFLAKEDREDESMMRIAKHGEEGASHAVTYYAVVETAAQKLAWLSLKPVTGRTHQLRAHMEHIGHPIIGDEKYFRIENYELPGGMQNKLHLLARRIAVPHPRGGVIDVTAPLPPHMQQTWNLLGLRRQALRSDRRGAGRMSRRLLTIWLRQRLADIKDARPRAVSPPGPQARRARAHRRRPDGAAPRRHHHGGVRGEASARRRGLQDAASRCIAPCCSEIRHKDGLHLEFGVYKGDSINHFAELAPDVTWYGFNSFEGLPEAWTLGAKTGAFSIGGNLPPVRGNVRLTKGFFEDTLPGFVAQHPGAKIALLHIDCDLYSSTVTILKNVAPMLVPGSDHHLRRADQLSRLGGGRVQGVHGVRRRTQACLRICRLQPHRRPGRGPRSRAPAGTPS